MTEVELSGIQSVLEAKQAELTGSLYHRRVSALRGRDFTEASPGVAMGGILHRLPGTGGQ